MKRNKKGFTLVELVIVIAVIAILAGVMVAVFSGVVRRANESAELQQVKNQELAQKADDVLKKLDNANWFSWEDFENSLAAKLTKAYQESKAAEMTVTTEDIRKVVKEALDDYAANLATGNTQLTEAQVKVIVENALANAKLGGVTENQVRTIVNTAVGDINTVTKSDIQKIVDAAVAKGLTAADVAAKITDANLASATSVSELATKVDTVITALNALTPLTNKDLEDKIIELLPVTKTAADATAFTELVGKLNSGSTIVIGWDASSEALAIDGAAGDKTLTIKGNKVGTLTVNAPKASLYVLCDVETLDVVETAQNSVHVVGKVTTLTANKGRIVVEAGGEVTNLTAAPATSATVKVVVEENATVTTLIAEYQKNGDTTNDWIEVENNGTVANAQLALTTTPATGATLVTTNVKVTNGANASGTTTDKIVSTTADEGTELSVDEQLAVVNDTNKLDTIDTPVDAVARIGTTFYNTFEAAIEAANDGDTVTLLKDITLSSTTFKGSVGVYCSIEINKDIIIDGNDKTITATGKIETNKSATHDVFQVMAYDGKTSDLKIVFRNLTVVSHTYQDVILAATNDNDANNHIGVEVVLDNVKIDCDGECIYSNGHLSNVIAKNCRFSHNGTYQENKDERYYSAVIVGYSGSVELYDTSVESFANGIATFPSGGTIDLYNVYIKINSVENSPKSGKAFCVTMEKAYDKYKDQYVFCGATVNVHSGTCQGPFYLADSSDLFDAVINITGGKFNTDPTAYLADGYVATETNGTWTVSAAN